MSNLTISAKNLGSYALETCCLRCEWIKLKIKKLPWQMFPGIFSSLAAFSEKITHAAIDSESDHPEWLREISDSITGYNKVPHWSKFSTEINGVTVRGVPDEILNVDGGYIIIDHKTAKHTEGQDKLLPMYDVQLNSYAVIAEKTRLFSPIKGLYLVYWEPQTSEEDAEKGYDGVGFRMTFIPHVLPLELDPDSLDPLLEGARKIYDGSMPEPGAGCKDCASLFKILEMEIEDRQELESE